MVGSMDTQEAQAAVESRVGAQSTFGPPNWKDARRVATSEIRSGALDGWADGPPNEVALVELDLNYPHPDFAGIVRVDDVGIWYQDGDGSVEDPAWRLHLLPWRHVDGMRMHRIS
jgi:hypothetical protein